MKKTVGVLAICVFLFSFVSCSSSPNEQNNTEQDQSQQNQQSQRHEFYQVLHDVTRQVNSRSFALLSMAGYSSYDRMPDYLKLVSDAINAYVESFQIIGALGIWYFDDDGKIVIVWIDVRYT